MLLEIRIFQLHMGDSNVRCLGRGWGNHLNVWYGYLDLD